MAIGIDADRMMRQAGMTADTWMLEAKSAVEKEFAKYPPAARATLIGAYMNAAAQDQVAMSLIGVAGSIDGLEGAVDRLNDPLQDDPPLQRETFGGLRLALLEIAGSIKKVGDHPCPLCCTGKKP